MAFIFFVLGELNVVLGICYISRIMFDIEFKVEIHAYSYGQNARAL